MADLILFHHAQGLTEGVLGFADRIREAGHTVTVPDMYAGATFQSLAAGVAHAESLGFDEFLTAAADAAAGLPERLVYAGFSLGALAAHRLAQTRPGALGALLYHHGDVPMNTFGDSWPAGVDVQIHLNENDEWRRPGVAEEFVGNVRRTARAQLFLYTGSSHLFTDSSLSDYDPASTTEVLKRSRDFLDGRMVG